MSASMIDDLNKLHDLIYWAEKASDLLYAERRYDDARDCLAAARQARAAYQRVSEAAKSGVDAKQNAEREYDAWATNPAEAQS